MTTATGEHSGGLDRRLVALAGFLVMFSLGAVYAWSVFVEPLQEQFDWTRWQATLPYIVLHAMVFLGTFTGGALYLFAGIALLSALIPGRVTVPEASDAAGDGSGAREPTRATQ